MSPSRSNPRRGPAGPAAPAAPAGESAPAARIRPLYRREPWLVAMLAAFVVGLSIVVAPAVLQRPLAIVAAVLTAASVVLLVLHPRDPAEEAALRRVGADP